MKEFTKADLKDRMVVELGDGEDYLVVDGLLLSDSGFMRLSRYRNDLTISDSSAKWDIVKVYDQTNTLPPFGAFAPPPQLLWERKEVKEVTMAEVEEKFGCKVKIVKEKEE